MKRWHTNKTKPRSNGSGFICIGTDGEVWIDEMLIDEYGKAYPFGGSEWIGWSPDWEVYKERVKLWAYVDKYFEKELKK